MTKKFRTAVLVVHGMGSQRPLQTVRGVVDAIWFDDDHTKGSKRLWTHPEASGVDIDLTVMTTSEIPNVTPVRTADFHELYWAHLMSETKAVAVLLWLFELARKGPRFTTAMNVLWWCVAIFLCLLLLSVSVLILKAFVWFSETTQAPQKLAIGPYIMVFIGAVAGLVTAWHVGAARVVTMLKKAIFYIALPVIVATAIAAGAWLLGNSVAVILPALGNGAAWAANVLLPPAIALLAAYLLMREWGLRAFAYAYGLSICFLLPFWVWLLAEHWYQSGSVIRALTEITNAVAAARWPWSLGSQSSVICAWVIIGVYMIANAAFLQPYLGDAARYFRNAPANIAVRREIRRQAVETLDLLHRRHTYDRIVVVAHSLGSVVAYDMLRAYYSRICDRIVFKPEELEPEFSQVDGGKLTPDQLRAKGRIIIRKMAENIKPADHGKMLPLGTPPEAWLVTDFVTLGSPLTHARYLMCTGESFDELNDNLRRRREEREFPTCPPSKRTADLDGWLAFSHPRTKEKKLHHGGLFALTRWTNLYFPISELFWGDPIGGPVGTEDDGKTRRPLFGTHLKDQPVWLRDEKTKDLFTHTAYWHLDKDAGRAAPHIAALREAINLEDR